MQVVLQTSATYFSYSTQLKYPAMQSVNSGEASSLDINNKSEAEKKVVEKYKETDRAVREHEAQHEMAAGDLASGKSFRTKKGPDGKMYAVAGEVNIDMSVEKGDPDATIRKMRRVKRAALAPKDPSAQDYKVAQMATNIERQAEQEKKALLENDNAIQNKKESKSYYVANRYMRSSNYSTKNGLIIDALA